MDMSEGDTKDGFAKQASSNAGGMRETVETTSMRLMPLVPTYKVDRLFPRGANVCFMVYALLCFIVYRVTPPEEMAHLPQGEKVAATVACATSSLSLLMVLSTFFLQNNYNGKMEGIIYAGCVVLLISAATNAQLAFFPTAVKVDQFTLSRVFLIRWCEFIPCAGFMTFLCDAIDVPRSKKAFRRVLMLSLCQSISCVSGILFPFCRSFTTWCILMLFSVLSWSVIFSQLREKRVKFLASSEGKTFMEKEYYHRCRNSYELMLLCACLWTVLVVGFFVNAYVHVMLPVGHYLRHDSMAMFVDAGFDALAKSAYMRQIMDAHMTVFHSDGLAQKQLLELRKLMSVLWSSSSDLIVLSVKHELKCMTLFSPAFEKMLDPGATDSSAEQRALVVETERTFEGDGDKDNVGLVQKVYHIGPSVFALGELNQAAVDNEIAVDSEKAKTALGILSKAWKHVGPLTKATSSFTTYEFVRHDGVGCKCEVKVLPHDENGMVAVVQDVTDRFRRFAAERKAESEVRQRQKEAQSQTRFVRHEVKNGLLASIELIDSLRNAIEELDRNTKEQIRRMRSNSEANKSAVDEDGSSIQLTTRRLQDLDSTLHEVLDTVLAEAMVRDVIYEVYSPRYESIDVLSLLKSTATNTDRFSVTLKGSPLPFLRLDPQLLRYIHRNAISNACKYGELGGEVRTTLDFIEEESRFEFSVVNLPGDGHEQLLSLGDNGNIMVFEQGNRLHTTGSDQFISSGDGAWIAQKCAKALGGGCSISFEKDKTTFKFSCPTEALVPVNRVEVEDFVVPPGTYGIAIDDSKIQRKLLSRILGHVGIEEDKRTVIGESPNEVFQLQSIIHEILSNDKDSKILCIIDENLDYSKDDGEHMIMSGSRAMEDVLKGLSRKQEARIFALVRSANDSTLDIARYGSRTHGFFPKATMNRIRVRELLAPLWADRFSDSEAT